MQSREYNAEACGALCSQCPLRTTGRMVAPREAPPAARYSLVSDYPSAEDVKLHEPLSGLAGRILLQGLKPLQLTVSDIHTTYAVLCRPLEGDLAAYLKAFRKRNRKVAAAYRAWEQAETKRVTAAARVLKAWVRRAATLRGKLAVAATFLRQAQAKPAATTPAQQATHDTRLLKLAGAVDALIHETTTHEHAKPAASTSVAPPLQTPLLAPTDACRPRLFRELARVGGVVVTLGAQAFESFTGEKGYLAAIGGPLEVEITGTKMQPADKRLVTCLGEAAAVAEEARSLVWLLPTVHPLNLGGKMEGYAGAFFAHLRRAQGYAPQGARCYWTDPPVIFTDAAARDALSALWHLVDSMDHAVKPDARLRIALDVETAGLDTAFSALRCIGISWRDPQTGVGHAVVVPLQLIDSSPVTSPMWRQAQMLLRQLFKHPRIVWGTHNGTFDRPVLIAQFAELPQGEDTLLLHHAIESEVPHSLAFLSSLLLDAPTWKEEKHGLTLTAGQDARLWTYNGRDAYRTLCIWERLLDVLSNESQGVQRCYLDACALQVIYSRMAARGLLVDETKRQARIAAVSARRARCVVELRDALEATVAVRGFDAEMQPEDADRIGAALLAGEFPAACLPTALYPTLDVAPTFDFHGVATMQAALRVMDIVSPPAGAGADPNRRSVAEDDLLGAVVTGTPRQRAFVGRKESAGGAAGYIGAQESSKLLATFLTPPTGADGRVRPHWKMHGTPTGRISCAEPNLMNVPSAERAIYCAPPGYVYMGADYSAIELWGVAICSQAGRLLDALKSADAHRINAEGLFRLSFADEIQTAINNASRCRTCLTDNPPASGRGLSARQFSLQEFKTNTAGQVVPAAVGQGKVIEVEWGAGWDCRDCLAEGNTALGLVRKRLKRLRELAKRYVYAANYRASETTIWANLVAEFPDLQLGDVVSMRREWDKMNPEIPVWVKSQEDLFARRKIIEKMGYLDSPIRGRRRYWTGKELGPSDAANYPIQSLAADVIDGALLRVDPAMRALGAHLVLQIHDNLTYEVPVAAVDRARDVLMRGMPGPYRLREVAGDWLFPVEVAVGAQWDKA